jgi:hypothetical protein
MSQLFHGGKLLTFQSTVKHFQIAPIPQGEGDIGK